MPMTTTTPLLQWSSGGATDHAYHLAASRRDGSFAPDHAAVARVGSDADERSEGFVRNVAEFGDVGEECAGKK